jgi:hypothetical protein
VPFDEAEARFDALFKSEKVKITPSWPAQGAASGIFFVRVPCHACTYAVRTNFNGLLPIAPPSLGTEKHIFPMREGAVSWHWGNDARV